MNDNIIEKLKKEINELKERNKKNNDLLNKEHKRRQEAEGETIIVKGIGMNSPEMKNAEAKIEELKKTIDLLNEDIQAKDLIDQQHRKLNGELIQVNKQLRKEVEEVKNDNKKLARHIEDRIDRSRKAGM